MEAHLSEAEATLFADLLRLEDDILGLPGAAQLDALQVSSFRNGHHHPVECHCQLQAMPVISPSAVHMVSWNRSLMLLLHKARQELGSCCMHSTVRIAGPWNDYLWGILR